MKINLFNPKSSLYPLRWIITICIVLAGWLAYANFTGWRLLSFSEQQEWKANGPGYHK